MITLYDKLETNFEHNGIGTLEQDIIDPKIHWIDNGIFSFEFEYPLIAKHGLEINNSSIIKARDPEQDNLFFVYKVIPSMGYIKVYAYQMFYKLAFNTINDTNIVNKNGQGALTQLSGATQYPHKFQFISDISSNANSRVVRKNPVEILLDSNLDNSFINRWGGHVIRHGFNISMNQNYGSNKGYKIQHKKDLMGYEATIDETTVVTRIRPVGYDGLLLPEIYIDSPLLNNYPEPRIQEYVYSDVKVGNGEGEFATDALAFAELRRLAKLEFSQNKVDVPRGIYKVDFVNLKETEEYKNFAPLKQILPGDVVAVEHEEDGINISAQMVEYNWDPLLLEYIDLTLGNYERSFTSTINQLDKIQTDIKDIHNQIELVYMSADGKNKIYPGETEPIIDQNSTEGDLWFKKNGDKTELWILRNVNGVLQWVVEISDATQEELRVAVNSAIEQADLDRAKAEQDVESAKQLAKQYTDDEVLKFDTKFNAETGAIRDELTTGYNNAVTAGKAYTDNKGAVFDTQLGLVKADVANMVLKANAAVLKADKAIEDVGFMKLDVVQIKSDAATALATANTAKTDASSALSKSNTAVADSAAALTKANKAITDSGTAITNAANAISRVGAVEITTGNLTTSYDTLSQTVGLKADKTVVDGINGKVTTQGTTITANATAISLKADKTVVDTINGVVTKHTTDIKVVADGLLLKADSSVVNTLNGTVTTHTTQIKAASDGLLLKADSSTVNTIKGTVDTHTTQIKATSDGLALKAEKSLVDTINSTVGTHTTQIKATSDGLALKAEKSLVDTVKSTVDKHTTDIKVVADGLALKAESSLVNTINGTVNTHTNQISANSTAIAARLTSAQVDSLVAAKKYVNETTLNATANGLSSSITQVSTDLSNLEIEGRNYFNPATNPIIKSGGGTFTVNDNVPYGFYAVGDQAQTLQARLNNVITGNGLWTVSFDLKGSQNGGGAVRVDVCDGTVTQIQTPTNNEYSRFSITVNVTNYGDGTVYHFVDFKATWSYIWVKNIKVEKGGKATGFTLAPDDMATLEKFTTLEATVNGIQTTVGTKANQSQVTQLATQWTQTTNLANSHTGQIANLGTDINLRVTKADLISQINVQADNILIQTGKLYLDVGSVTMSTAFVTDLNAKTLTAVTANIANIRSQILTADVITSVQLKVDNAMMDKLTATTAVVDYLFTKTAFVNNLSAKTLTAITANIATIRSQVLIANTVQATHLVADVATLTKLFATDANVQILTAKTAFINSVKAIDIVADRVTGGTFNAALMNVVGLNAASVVSGTFNGLTFTNPYSINGLTGTTVLKGDLTSSYTKTNGQYGTMAFSRDRIFSTLYNPNGSLVTGYNLSSEALNFNSSFGSATYNFDNVIVNRSDGAKSEMIYAYGGYGLQLHSDYGLKLGRYSFGNKETLMEIGTGNSPDVRFGADVSLLTHDLYNVGKIRFNAESYITAPSADGLDLRARSFTKFTLSGWDAMYLTRDGSTGINNMDMYGNLNMQGKIDMKTNSITNSGRIYFNDQSYVDAPSIDSSRVNARTYTAFTLSGWDVMYLVRDQNTGNNRMDMYGNINMNSFQLLNNSDRRLKQNIQATNVVALDAYRNLNVVDYEWRDPKKPQGRHLGVIAQETPFWSEYDASTDIWNVSSSKQIMYNSLGIKELTSISDSHTQNLQSLNQKVVSIDSVVSITNSIANRAMNKVLQVDNEVQQMKNKIVELELKIKQLESVA